eukprot:COSAG01_NODE_669_length_14379_cov_292.353011_4_plen_302_part_00
MATPLEALIACIAANPPNEALNELIRAPILRHRLNPFRTGAGGTSPVAEATWLCRADILRVLLERPVYVAPRTLGVELVRAARAAGDDTACVQLLLQRGAPVDAPTPSPDGTGATALMVAARQGAFRTVACLLGAGADTNVRVQGGGLDGWSALLFAAQGKCSSGAAGAGNYSATMRCLLQAGADPNVADHNGFSALMATARYRNPAGTAVLLAHGAEATAPNRPHPGLDERTAIDFVDNGGDEDHRGDEADAAAVAELLRDAADLEVWAQAFASLGLTAHDDDGDDDEPPTLPADVAPAA